MHRFVGVNTHILVAPTQYKLKFFNYFMKLNTLYEILNNSVKNFSERIAFSLWKGGSYTFKQVGEKVAEVQELLRSAGLKKGDKVVVLTGKDKGKQGEITAVMPKDNKAIVDGINIAIRHARQTQTTQGGRTPKAMPIDLSNLALLDANGKATRVGFRMEGDKKVRFAKTTGDVI